MSNNQLTGAAGEALVSFLIHHELRWVHREQQRPIDCGVDGQIQIVEDGLATTLHLGTQVKAGVSEFREPVAEGWVYRPKNPNHVDYWLSYPMPVLLVLADNVARRAYWQHASASTLQRTGVGWKLVVPRANELNAAAREALRTLAVSQHTDLAIRLVDAMHKAPPVEVQPAESPATAQLRLNAAQLLAALTSGGQQLGGSIDADGVRALLTQLVEAGFGSLEVLLGYRLPHSSTRVDVVLCGARPGSGEPTYLIVELKAWGSFRSLIGDLVLVDGGTVPVLKPAEQVRRYRDFLVDSATSLPADSVLGLAYLYKMEDGTRLDDAVRSLFDPAADAPPTADSLLDTPQRPARTFLDAAVNELQGRDRVVLLDEQKVAFELVVHAVDRAGTTRRGPVVVVLGGPGSGKSTVGMSLFSEFSQSGKSVYHATGSRLLTTNMRRYLAGGDQRLQTMFKYFNNFIDVGPAALDVLICDEAHRIRQSSPNGFSVRSSPQRSQLEELITAAKVPVFLLDEEQTVRPGETGTLDGITEAAKRLGRDVQVVRLRGGFRTDWYTGWVDKLLGLDGEPVRWAGHDGEFAVHSAGSPHEMESWLSHQRKEHGGTARIAAGYCWKWSDPATGNGAIGLVPDVKIGDWCRPWNAKPGLRVPGMPSADFWATDERGFSQVGSIYTAQGLEYDWAGVIFGDDFVRRGHEWVALRKHSHDPAVKRAPEEDVARLIRNAYRVLLTRGVRGVCIYSVDPETQRYLRSMIEDG